MLPHDLSDPRATLEDFALLAFRSRAAGKGPTIDFREIFGAVRFPTFSTVSVESRCGAVALGRTYLLPSLSSGGASIVPPWLRFHIPLIGRVEDWRAGLGRSLGSLLSRPFVCECPTISTMPRLQPPPRRTQRADFPHCAPPFASRQAYGTYPAGATFGPSRRTR